MIERLFGEEEHDNWSKLLARTALYTLTDEHARNVHSQVADDARHHQRYAELLGDA